MSNKNMVQWSNFLVGHRVNLEQTQEEESRSAIKWSMIKKGHISELHTNHFQHTDTILINNINLGKDEQINVTAFVS